MATDILCRVSSIISTNCFRVLFLPFQVYKLQSNHAVYVLLFSNVVWPEINPVFASHKFLILKRLIYEQSLNIGLQD